MPRRRNSNRRRRGRSGFLYKVLSMLVICGAIIAALTLFFRVNKFEVTGNIRYSEQEILDAAGVEAGTSLYLLNKHDVANRLVEKLPYLQLVDIDRKPPDTLAIQVEECGTPLAVVQDGSAWFVSPRGKIVEQTAASGAEGHGVIDGCQILAPSVGTSLALATEYATQQRSLLSLMSAMEEVGFLDQVNAIHLDELSYISIDFAERFTIKVSYNEDYTRKFHKLEQILAGDIIQDNMTGTFDMRGEGSRDIVFQQNIR